MSGAGGNVRSFSLTKFAGACVASAVVRAITTLHDGRRRPCMAATDRHIAFGGRQLTVITGSRIPTEDQ